jgi:hypothetical protein
MSDHGPYSDFILCASSASITWERIASRRRPAFSSHLVTLVRGVEVLDQSQQPEPVKARELCLRHLSTRGAISTDVWPKCLLTHRAFFARDG